VNYVKLEEDLRDTIRDFDIIDIRIKNIETKILNGGTYHGSSG
jgi:hypothetical protein